MGWWKRWKEKHWYEKAAFTSQWDIPPMRRAAQWVARQWREQPLALLGVVAGLIAAVAGLLGGIAAIIQALR